MKSHFPQVSIIIVNYNGAKFLKECFSSIEQMNFPKDKYEVIMVDNNSKDLSVKFTRDNFPSIKIIESIENLGFAGGCNLGVKNSKGKYVVLLNNDTKVGKEWLYFLVKRIESDKKIAVVNSKLLLYFPFIQLSINSDIYMRSEFTNTVNFQPVGVLVENIVLEKKYLQPLIKYRSGFYEKEKGAIPARWTMGVADILIPCEPDKSAARVTLTIRSEKSNSDLSTRISVKLGEDELIKDNLGPHEVKQYELVLDHSMIKKHFVYAVQNSGVVVFKNGYGRDRGAVVSLDRTQSYEIENSFFKQGCEINSFCGASAIIRKDLYDKLGGFDESFFMYYEDVDLSLQLRRMGWDIVYEPKSEVYHIHAGSSGEWSSLFTYNVEKNHLALLVKHFPLKVYIKELMLYIFLWGLSFMKMVKWRLKEHWELFEDWKEKTECRSRVLKWLMMNTVQLIKKRFEIDSFQKKTMAEIYQQLY